MLLHIALCFLLFEVGTAQNSNRFVGQYVQNIGVPSASVGSSVWNAAVYYDIFNQRLLYNLADPINPGFQVYVIRPAGLTFFGQYCSIANVNGNPAISFFNFAAGVLGYVRATNSLGTQWGAPVYVDTDIFSNTGEWTSLQMVKGQPTIAYMGNGNSNPYDGGGSLRYKRSLDPIGATWGPVQVLRAGQGNALYITLRICAGFPCVSFYDNREQVLYFLRADDDIGWTWSPNYVRVDPATNVGQNARMEINPTTGIPYIVYTRQSDNTIWLGTANSTVGSFFSVNQVIAADATQQNVISVALTFNPLTGRPMVLYGNGQEQSVRLIQANNLEGSGQWQNSVLLNVDPPTTVTQALSVAVNVYGSPTSYINTMWYNQLDGTVYLVRILNSADLTNRSDTFAIDNGQYPTLG